MINNSGTGILVTNIGTPHAPTSQAVRHYLKKFLSDPRVIELPHIIWRPILYSIILPFRSKSSANLYQHIWTDQGSPLLLYSQKIVEKLQAQLHLPIELGMQYSTPSIPEALEKLKRKNIHKIIVLPLYPQYSGTTTASTLDNIATTFKKWRYIPEICTINDYSEDTHYIKAISQSIQNTWKTHGKKYLLFSFHGIPLRYAKAGDPYPKRCECTAYLVAKELNLQVGEWSIAFQSRIGCAKWLTPYTDHVLKQLPKQGIVDLQVVCPGFPTDCLETLEEIAIRGKKEFFKAGGKSFYYIPALNDCDEHIAALTEICKKKACIVTILILESQ